MAISSVGIGSGLPLSDLINQLVAAEAAPTQGRIDRREASLQTELSAIGILKGALSDFQDKLKALGDVDSFKNRTSKSSNIAVASLSADQTSAQGTYSLEVAALASAQKLVAQNGYSDASEGVLTFTNQSGESFDVTVGTGNATLEGIADAINDEATNFGITAKIINVGGEGRLVINSDSTGIDERITTISATGTGDIQNFAYDYALSVDGDDTNWDQTSAALNASFSLEGQPMTSGSNTLEDVIPGATITLKDTTESSSPIELTVSTSTASVTKLVEEFVSAFNELNNLFQQQTSYNSASEQGGVLQGDALARSVQSQVRSLVTGSGSAFGGLTALANMGITTQSDGSLAINSTQLNTTVSENFEDLTGFFADETLGLANRLNELLDNYLSSTGSFSTRTDSLNESLKGLDSQRDALTSRLEKLEARYLAQFSAMDALVANLTSTGNFLTQQLSSIAQIQTARYKN